MVRHRPGSNIHRLHAFLLTHTRHWKGGPTSFARAAEVELQEEISTTLAHLDDILELVHSREAMEVANRYEMEDRLEECCPEEEPEPTRCFKDCESPKLSDYKPSQPDWRPVHYDQPKENKPK